MQTAPDRQDARLKVMGKAIYAAEHQFANLTYAVLLQSTIAKGHVLKIDARAALRNPKVLLVLTPETMPKLTQPDGEKPGGIGEGRLPLQDLEIHHDGQHLAVVVAETMEAAQHAASLVRVEYAAEPYVVEIEHAPDTFEPKEFFKVYDLQYRRGDAAAGLATASVKLEAVYETPVEHHNPIEPHATIAAWTGNCLTLFDATQGVIGTREVIAQAFGLHEGQIRVVSPFLGGGFGCKGFVWPHVILTAVAARQVDRPVKLVLGRAEMFTSNGHRARTIQAVSLGADIHGKLVAARHEVQTHTSEIGHFCEPAGCVTPKLYAIPNLATRHVVSRLNLGTPTATRGPGEAPGSFGLECAMDEMAHQLSIDPVTLRIRNHADVDPEKNKPWSSKHLIECYQRGAEHFGWSRRHPKPRQLRHKGVLIGLGMATATYPANRNTASAKVRVLADGTAEVLCAAQDLGTGSYTVMSQVVAEVLDLPIEQVRSRLGDTNLPPAPLAGGSRTTASIAPAIRAAAEDARRKLFMATITDKRSPLYGAPVWGLHTINGYVVRADEPKARVAFKDIARGSAGGLVEGDASIDPAGLDAANPDRRVHRNDGKSEEPFSWHSFGAHFVEVHVDPELGIVRAHRVVSVMDVGRILSPKTARSQIQGGVIWGVGMALFEKTVVDSRTGRIVTRSLADYLIPTNPDAPNIEVHFLDHPDPHFNALGARGLGEIGIVGVAAAIANAVYNATGKRIRTLPITPETLL